MRQDCTTSRVAGETLPANFQSSGRRKRSHLVKAGDAAHIKDSNLEVAGVPVALVVSTYVLSERREV